MLGSHGITPGLTRDKLVLYTWGNPYRELGLAAAANCYWFWRWDTALPFTALLVSLSLAHLCELGQSRPARRRPLPLCDCPGPGDCGNCRRFSHWSGSYHSARYLDHHAFRSLVFQRVVCLSRCNPGPRPGPVMDPASALIAAGACLTPADPRHSGRLWVSPRY